MKPAPLTLRRPATVEECLDLLRTDEEVGVKVIAGGQSLMPLLALRMANPDMLVDLGLLDELERVDIAPDTLHIGARVRHRQLTEEPLRSMLPVLADAAGHIGHSAIRNRGTIGGSLAHADPAAELPAVMVLLGADIECRSASAGTRLVPATEFFAGPYMTALEDDELLAAVRVPRPSAADGHGFVEFSPRHGDYARAGAAATLSSGADGRIRAARVVLFAIAMQPVDVSEHVQDVIGARPEACDWNEVAHTVAATLPDPTDSDRAHRRRLAAVACRRALREAAGRLVATSRGPRGA